MPSVTGIQNSTISNSIVTNGDKKAAYVVALSGTALALSETFPPLILADASAATQINLPAVTTANAHMMFTIQSKTGGNTLTIKDGATTVGTVAAGKARMFYNDGTNWTMLNFA